MKPLLLIIFIAVAAAAGNQDGITREDWRKLLNKIRFEEPEERRSEVLRSYDHLIDSCSIDEDKFMDKVNDALKKLISIDVSEKTTCSFLQTDLIDSLDPLIGLIDSSCNKVVNAGQIVRFFSNTFKSTIKFICTSSGEILMEQVNPCLFKNYNEIHRHCVEETVRAYEYVPMSDFRNVTIENYFCSIFRDVSSICLEGVLAVECPLQVTKKSVRGWAGAITENCPQMDNLTT